MLTVEFLRTQGALSTLDEATVSVIAALSKADEESVLNTKIGEMHQQYEEDVLKSSGIAKKEGEKSFDYLKRTLSEMKQPIDTLKSDLAKAKQTETDLLKQIAENSGDATLRQRLKDAEDRLVTIQEKLTATTDEYKTFKETSESDFAKARIEMNLDLILSNLAVKEGVDDSVKSIMFTHAKSDLLKTTKPSFEQTSTGENVLVFRDLEGKLINHDDNALKPKSAEDMLYSKLGAILEPKNKKEGSGRKTGQHGDKLDGLGLAKNQVEADDMIHAHLVSQGLSRIDEQYHEKAQELRTSYEVSKLPIS